MPKVPVLVTLALVVLAGFARTGEAQTGAQTQQTAVADIRARAEAGDAEAQFRLGRMFLDGDGVSQDHVQSVAWFRKAAAQGHPKAQNNLGNAFANGLGVPRDAAQAVEWFRRAAEQGEMLAQSNLGVMYSDGNGVAQDLAQAAAWYRKAADQGFAPAQFYLGTLYDGGRGVPEDPAQAAAWYRKAAAQGFPEAQFFLGQSYINGRGVPQDDAQALVWFRNAAALNNAAALYNLGMMYQAGRGVPQDPVEAYKLLTLGVATESNPGVQGKSLAENREALARSLTAEQRAEAERRAREWTEAHPVGQTSQPPSQDATRPALQLADVSVTPRRIGPGGSFVLDIAYTAADPAGSPKAAVTLSFSFLSGGNVLLDTPAETVESASGQPWKITKPLTAASTPGTYVIRVRLALGETIVTRDVEFEIAR
jgi:TPR repeat protein